ncbi:MAG: DUF86 domain-containing protein [Deltaproteobacteria bacterium]|nr:DUF86 domain-containing protein [Deltaproteobacteria bacterium]
MTEAHLTLLREMLALLDRYAGVVTRAQIEQERVSWLKVKAAIELGAQCAIDLALDLVARRGLGVPQSYRDAFALLARAGLIDPGLAVELERWAGLRNVLVHVYTALDLDRLCRALSETEPLRAFLAIAARELGPGANP